MSKFPRSSFAAESSTSGNSQGIRLPDRKFQERAAGTPQDVEATIDALSGLTDRISRAILIGQIEGKPLDNVIAEICPASEAIDKRSLLLEMIRSRRELWKVMQPLGHVKDVNSSQECSDPLQGAMLIPFALHPLPDHEYQRMVEHISTCHACHDELWLASVPLAALHAHHPILVAHIKKSNNFKY